MIKRADAVGGSRKKFSKPTDFLLNQDSISGL